MTTKALFTRSGGPILTMTHWILSFNVSIVVDLSVNQWLQVSSQKLMALHKKLKNIQMEIMNQGFPSVMSDGEFFKNFKHILIRKWDDINAKLQLFQFSLTVDFESDIEKIKCTKNATLTTQLAAICFHL